MESSRGEPGWSSIIRSLQLKGAALCYWMFSPRILEPIYSDRGFKWQQWKAAVALLNVFFVLIHFVFLAGRLTRSFISDNLLYHWEQSLVSDRKAGRLHRGWSKDRGGVPPVPQGFISCPDIMMVFFSQVSRWIFCSLTYGSKSQWKGLSVIVVFSQVTS